MAIDYGHSSDPDHVCTRIDPDITVYGEDNGRSTVFIFTPRSAAGREWIAVNVAPGATWFGAGIAVENRYAGELTAGMIADGLVVR